MTATEVLVVIFGLLIGYWIVSRFGSGDNGTKARTETPSAQDNKAQGRREQAQEEAQGRREHAGADARHSREQAEHKEKAQQRQCAAEDAALAPWHKILNIAPNANTSEIRRAYKTLMSQYHPDKVAALGPELTELCERKTKEINSAYDRAMAERRTA